VHASAKLRLICGFHHGWCIKKRIALLLLHFTTFYTPKPPENSIKISKIPAAAASQTVQKQAGAESDRLFDMEDPYEWAL
jgi:hypothetical protein